MSRGLGDVYKRQLRYICSNGYLPDARFPESAQVIDADGDTENSNRLVAANWDFLSRVYLQEYYRGDD